MLLFVSPQNTIKNSSGNFGLDWQFFITMSDLNRVVLCLEKIRSKNLGQNPDNLKQFLMKGFNYECEEAMKLIDEAINTNIIKSITFNGKVA